jgi:hypothetical protein
MSCCDLPWKEASETAPQICIKPQVIQNIAQKQILENPLSISEQKGLPDFHKTRS